MTRGSWVTGPPPAPPPQFIAELAGPYGSGLVGHGTAPGTVKSKFEDIASSSGASLVGFLQGTVQDELLRRASVKQFGAVGDGVADDTAAIKAALATNPSTLLFPAGTYKITSTEVAPITVGSNIAIIGYGATIQCLTSRVLGAFKITGSNVTVEGLCFDGNDTSLNVLMIGDTASQVALRKVEVKRCKQQAGDAAFAVGILVQCGSQNVSIDECYVHHIDASVTGIARGILGTGYGTSATHFDKLVINGGLIENITPSADADGIVFQPDDTVTDVNSSVNNVRFRTCAKRAIKIMASGVSVNGGEVTLPVSGGYAGVSVYGDRCKVRAMKITGGFAEHGIDIGSTATTCGSDTLIDGVTIEMTSQATNDGIRVYGDATHLVNDVLIVNVKVKTVRHGVHLSCAGSRVTVISPTITNTTQNGVYNAGSGGTYSSQVSVIGGNFASITGYTVRNDGGTLFNAVGNLSDQSGTGSHGNLSVRSNFAGNLIAGQNVQGSGTVAPTAGTWDNGDFIWNTNPSGYGVVGWECTVSGTPGTWRVVMAGCERSTTANRPTLTTMGVASNGQWQGTMYFDTTLAAAGKPIWWTGAAWVDATGATV